MTRVAERQKIDTLINQTQLNKLRIDKLSEQISSGIKVSLPSDSSQSATIAQFQTDLVRIDGHFKRIENARAQLSFQDEIITQSNDTLIRAKEIAVQMANEVQSVENRNMTASEIWSLRDQLVSLANSQFQGQYIYGGVDDNDPPFDVDTATYTTFGSTSSQQRYSFDDFDAPPTLTNVPDRQVQVSDDVSVKISTAGEKIFENAIQSLEKLGRALEGYKTDVSGSDFSQLTFPTNYSTQTAIIQETITELDNARVNDIEPERASIAERMKRIDTVESIVNFSKISAQDILSKLQDTDIAEAASELTLAQTALEASYSVTSRLLQLSILNYL
jgi:flagellar hook-associated protein 3 FlgL